VQSLGPGVVSTPLLDLEYSPSLLGKSYGSKDGCHDPEAFAEGMKLQLGKLSSLLTGTCRCLGNILLSMYFRKDSGYGVVYDNSASGLISIPLAHFPNNRNFRTRSRICTEMICVPVVGVTSM
jgi:hypothetical protein